MVNKLSPEFEPYGFRQEEVMDSARRIRVIGRSVWEECKKAFLRVRSSSKSSHGLVLVDKLHLTPKQCMWLIEADGNRLLVMAAGDNALTTVRLEEKKSSAGSTCENGCLDHRPGYAFSVERDGASC